MEQQNSAPQAQKQGEKGSINKILTEAMKYVDRRNPYAWGGKGEALTKKNVDKLRAQYGEATFRHLTKEGDWGWAVGKSGMQCVDCSGMTQQVYKKAVGVDVGINTTKQRAFGKDIGVENALPGDLLVGYATDVDGKTCGHCGIMGDNGKLIEAKGRRSGCVNECTPKEAGMTVAFHVVDYDGEEAGSNIKQKKNPAFILTSAEASAAIRYNKHHNYKIVKKIQKKVGAPQSGVFNVLTVNKIAKWQKKHGIHADGQFGPSSMAKAGIVPPMDYVLMPVLIPLAPAYPMIPAMGPMMPGPAPIFGAHPHMGPHHHMGPMMPPMVGPMLPPMMGPILPPLMGPMLPPMMGPHHHKGPHPHMGPAPFMGPHMGPMMPPVMGPILPPMMGPILPPIMGPILPPMMGPILPPMMGPMLPGPMPIHQPGPAPKQPNVKPAHGSGHGAAAVAFAEKYLYSKTHMYTKDFIKGKPHLKHLVDVSFGGSSYNYGYNCNCANFVSAVLQNVGLLGGHYIGVSALKSAMKSEGYKQVSRAQAQPGDIWLNKDGGSHTEIVADNSNGKIKLIGSNNAGTKKQRVTYDVNAGNSKGEFYTKA